jgi:NAD(P)-dependent dehydrogenase (short-subunit alcohol dehydrogenase family)
METVVTAECQGCVDSFDTCSSRDQVAVVDGRNIKRLSKARLWPARCLSCYCAASARRHERTQNMSRTMETTPGSDVLSHAETRTDRQPDICKKLARKVAVITGGSTGMGLATAKRFVQEGTDHVFITGRRKDVLDVAVAEIGDKATGIPGDVASLNDIDRLYDSVKGYGRKLDVVFANAGIAQLASFGTVDEKFYDLHFDANVKGLFFTVQKALPLLNDGASIILNASIATVKGFSGTSVYSATKAAVRSFARTWTNELRERRIRVNAISPGHIDTPIFQSWQQGDELTKMKEDLAKKRSAWPARRS